MYPVLSALLLTLSPSVFAQNNQFQPYRIPNASPGSWQEVKRVVKEGESRNPRESIHANLEQAMCGGWDFSYNVNGVYGQPETYTLYGEQKNTNPQQGLIPRITGVPGRDTQKAYGNQNSGLGQRREQGGNAADITFNGTRRVETNTFSGFDYPQDPSVCGFTTVCRPGNHPDQRAPAPFPTFLPERDNPGFLCEHPCQRPLDSPGKPQNRDPARAQSVDCGQQQPYAPVDEQIKYACGGGETQGPNGNFCGELQANGPLGGLCQDLNSWVYILWRKPVHVCYESVEVPTAVPGVTLDVCFPVPIYRYEKGPNGFPAEHQFLPRNFGLCVDRYEAYSVNESCSDDPYGMANVQQIPGVDEDGNPIIAACNINVQFDMNHIGTSCRTCEGEDCRLFPETNNVIVPDIWFEPFPAALPDQCLVAAGDCDVVVPSGIDGVNHGPWPSPPGPEFRRVEQEREYISYFREYTDATYERASLDQYIPEDDHQKSNIPVACYGMYDTAPEDAKDMQTSAEDKRCTIAAYYAADDGDGDRVNFWNMAETQKGKGAYRLTVQDDPFNDPKRPFSQRLSLWFPQLGNAFSLLNQEVFDSEYNSDLSFALLAPDDARQRATVQIDSKRRLSSGALIRAFDDTVTIEPDLTRERRSVVEWWQEVQTQMHKQFSPPTVRLLLPSTWSIDINPLDPMYTPPAQENPDNENPDPRSETIEVQVQAGDDLIGSIIGFMERNLLLRVESEPIPVVVPVANPTELRAWALGWETWAKKQESEGLPGADRAREVAAKLQQYAERADEVRTLRGELPKYAAKLLHEQRKIGTHTADWVTENLRAYQNYLTLNWGISLLKNTYETTQRDYRSTEENQAFPWCRNSRFTAPIYSLLDPWLPGRENNGDTTGGFGPCIDGTQDCSALFADYQQCIQFVEQQRAQGEENAARWPSNSVCDAYIPLPPAFPEIPTINRDADIVLDFTAFKEIQKTVKLPVLKPIQIRMDFDTVRPPGLQKDDEPNYPVLADLPEVPVGISTIALQTIPTAVLPEGQPAQFLRVPDTLGQDIALPEIDVIGMSVFLFQTYQLVDAMTDEYTKFWESLTKEQCENGERGTHCVIQGTEQDCIRPYDDPNERCVHFEADLKERLQRIGSRPAVLLFEDFFSVGSLRKPLTVGQTTCERTDWACLLLNAYTRKPRDGWQLFMTDEYDPDPLIERMRTLLKEATSNILEEDEQFKFDIPQEQIFENYRIPEGERIETYRERFTP